MAPGIRLTILYDADCGVCRHTARTLRTLDWRERLHFAALQGFVPTAAGDPAGAELEAALHVRDERGTWHAGGEAALEIARVVPALAPLALVGRLPGMGRVADVAYEAVAANRHAISGWLGLDRCRFNPDRLAD
jgi:predicted DCC family thiol-disulfide oxidoreductase YuxK